MLDSGFSTILHLESKNWNQDGSVNFHFDEYTYILYKVTSSRLAKFTQLKLV